MTNAHADHDTNPKETGKPGTPAHQREDQPLKELNEDPDEAENGTASDSDRRNAQGDHAGSAHHPSEFARGKGDAGSAT